MILMTVTRSSEHRQEITKTKILSKSFRGIRDIQIIIKVELIMNIMVLI